MHEYRPLRISNPFGGPVLYIPETGSVLEDAADCSAADSHGTVLTAGFQSRGRGRGGGRSWEAEHEASMLAAILIARQHFSSVPTGSLSLRTALALALYLEERGLRPQVKWPNDVLLRGRKASGILIELTANLIRIGIGMNCLQRDFPEELRSKATSLVLEGVPAEPVREHLRRFLPRLREVMLEKYIVPEVESRLYRKGETCVLLEGGTEQPRRLKGTVRGVQEDGALRFEVQGTVRSIYAGEFTFPASQNAV